MEQEKLATKPAEVVSSESLIDKIVDEMGIERDDVETLHSTKSGVQYLIEHLLKTRSEDARVDERAVNVLIDEIDQQLSDEVNRVLHEPTFQKLESAWKGLKFVVDRTDFRENVQIEVLNASDEDLRKDFEDSPEIPKSAIYKHLYTSEYGTFGGNPFGAIIGNFEFGPSARDLELLKNLGTVAAIAHAPFIAAAAPKMFDKEKDIRSLSKSKELDRHFEAADYRKWNAFRESPVAQSVGLTLPRFLLRLPYHHEANPIRSFKFDEDASDAHEKFLWGNAAFAFASRLTDSFAKYRWCPNIIGPQNGGSVDDLPVHVFDSMGATEAMIPTEIEISERLEFQLSEQGFIPLTVRKASDNACFFSANSCQKPKFFGTSKEDKEAESNFRLGTQLPYMFIVSRLAHYLKVHQREQLGGVKERTDLEKELNKWIKPFVADFEAQASVRARRPLRQASVKVSDVEGQPGWYKVDLSVRPHFKYMGANFTLSLVGRLDTDKKS